MTPLNAETYQDWLDYNDVTGIFTWKKSPNGTVKAGAVAGYVQPSTTTSYIMIGLKKRRVCAHRIAFAMMNNSLPAGEVDHINGDGTDNRWSNLREVSGSLNQRNMRINSRNKSGTMGVFFCKRDKRWRACINGDKGRISLGYFKTKDEAVTARLAAEPCHGYHPNHGRLR